MVLTGSQVQSLLKFKSRVITTDVKNRIEELILQGASLDVLVVDLQQLNSCVTTTHVKNYLRRYLKRLLKTELTIKVRNKVLSTPKIVNQDDNFTKIDALAMKCYSTQTRERELFFEKLLELAKPYINSTAARYTKRDQDRQDLIAILSQDLWRLINKWEPNEKYRFHYLMLRQFKNQAFNELSRFAKANTPIRESDVQYNDVDILDMPVKISTNVLDDLESRDLITKLLDRVSDEKTKTLLELALQDLSFTEIKEATNRKSVLAIKRRHESVRPILIDLIYGSCNQFIRDFVSQLDDTDSKKIMTYYCAGKTTQEIKEILKLPVDQVRNCVTKHKKSVYSLLMS